MIGSPGGVARTIGLRVRKNAKPGTSEGLAYIIVKMLAVPHKDQKKYNTKKDEPNLWVRLFSEVPPISVN